MRNFNLLILLIVGLLVFIVISFYFGVSKGIERSNIEEMEDEAIGWCGNTKHTFYYREGHGSEYYEEGKSLFKNNCAMCHHKNMKDPLAGPGLGGAIGRWRNDTVSLLSYLNNPREYINNGHDLRMIALHKEYYHAGKDNMEGLTIEEVKRLVDYIELVK